MEQKFSAYDEDSQMRVEMEFQGPAEVDSEIWQRLLAKLEKDYPELVQEAQGQEVPLEELEKMPQREYERVRGRQEAITKRKQRLLV